MLNLFLVIFGIMLVHKPLVNFVTLGRPFDTEIFIQVVNHFPPIFYAQVFFLSYSQIAFFV